ncbi:LysR substrate-binding domain-containing protein [Arhodomonas aquaeolei]|uniref:LysR substrate-binding domain-containing protein n=1 Tax=Arhodomonas aquaeolei TaxID=2369 RepID=UPI002167F4E9|nr:LysR substrate-binding domain-containing protein [Arhodomonas aquaeolei]MCS4503794.1 LysR substrate-binding domain-containing protein [Arhodomonas aquaeolei]
MKAHVDPDRTLVKMPSLTALKSFVAAAKYCSFTRAAESLCVSQAAISKQVRELEAYVNSDLFLRSGRAIELTEAGQMLFDAAYLSFVNIAHAAERIRNSHLPRRELYICASPAFSSLWLAPRLATFFRDHPGLGINVLTTDDFLSFNPSEKPDALISMNTALKEGHKAEWLFSERIFPVCSPDYLADNPEVATFEGLRDTTLLELSSFRRWQIWEHVDWAFWFERVGAPLRDEDGLLKQTLHANDYNLVLQMAVAGQGVALGWDHLVSPFLESGQLIRPMEQELILKEKAHYLFYNADVEDDQHFSTFRRWLLSHF